MSLICNIVFAVLIFKPLPEDEQHIINLYRETKKQDSNVNFEKYHNEVVHISNQIIIKISENWDLETTKSFFSKAVINEIGDEKLATILKLYSKLGKFKKQLLPETVESVPGKSNIMLYGTNVIFENGEGHISFILEKSENKWLLTRININSELFLN